MWFARRVLSSWRFANDNHSWSGAYRGCGLLIRPSENAHEHCCASKYCCVINTFDASMAVEQVSTRKVRREARVKFVAVEAAQPLSPRDNLMVAQSSSMIQHSKLAQVARTQCPCRATICDSGGQLGISYCNHYVQISCQHEDQECDLIAVMLNATMLRRELLECESISLVSSKHNQTCPR